MSRTRSWLDVSHDTQIVWRTTTWVGCALYTSRGVDYLICRYYRGAVWTGDTFF